jgi:uncharacterized protein
MTTSTMTSTTHFRFGMLLTLTLSLSACFQSNPPVKTERYSLPEVTIPPSASPTSNASKHTLVLNRIELADYLDTDRIVIQLDDITMRPARDHLWVDNLAQELRRGLRTRLTSRLDDTMVVDQQHGLPAANQLQLTIEQFHGQMQGYAVLSGQWQVITANQQVGVGRSFKFSTPLAEDGYAALVRALGQDLDLLSDQIASQLGSLP